MIIYEAVDNFRKICWKCPLPFCLVVCIKVFFSCDAEIDLSFFLLETILCEVSTVMIITKCKNVVDYIQYRYTMNQCSTIFKRKFHFLSQFFGMKKLNYYSLGKKKNRKQKLANN